MQTTFRRLAVTFAVLAVSLPLFAASLGSSLSNDGFMVDLLSVERKGNVVTVKWSVRNDNKGRTYYDIEMIGGSTTTYLVDEENGTKYYVLTDKEGNMLATEHQYNGIYEEMEPGTTKRFWAKYPAPPAAVKTINVLFTNSDPFESVPITDKK